MQLCYNVSHAKSQKYWENFDGISCPPVGLATSKHTLTMTYTQSFQHVHGEMTSPTNYLVIK